eukprot:615176_1
MTQSSQNFAEKSDILRLAILHRFGGLYVDIDFECLRSLDTLNDHLGVGMYSGLSNTGTVELNNGLMACVPGHPLMKRYLDGIKEEATSSTAMGIIKRTGPGHYEHCSRLPEKR